MRLIDADELLKQAYTSGDWDRGEHPMVVDVYDIEIAPTINEWHYPSKGEYPTENERVLVYIKEHGKTPTPQIGRLKWNGEFFELSHSDYFKDEVLAWQYIVPPQEKV